MGLQRFPHWALAQDDKKNGFNSISRKSIFAGLKRWFPQLLPTARLFYSEPSALYTAGLAGRQRARATEELRCGLAAVAPDLGARTPAGSKVNPQDQDHAASPELGLQNTC